jgi:hypothetical protein
MGAQNLFTIGKVALFLYQYTGIYGSVEGQKFWCGNDFSARSLPFFRCAHPRQWRRRFS